MIALWALSLLLSQPLFTHFYYTTMLARGAYPPNADSIAIPIYHEFYAWIIFLPLELTIIAYILMHYPGSISLFTWNKERKLWSILWLIIFGLLILDAIWGLTIALEWLNWPEIINSMLFIFLYLYLRAIVTTKKGWI